jgi:glycine/D-amino acid oxidase-like deaminating enzyme
MVSNGAVAPRSTHTVIIGGGIIGASTLYYSAKHAARRDAADSSRITLIEGSKELAPAASGKSGGFLALDWHGSSTASLAELSYDLHNQLAKEGSGTKRWGYREVEVRA